MKNKKLIVCILLVFVFILIFIYMFLNMDNNIKNKDNYSASNIEDKDFSDYDKYTINLSDEKDIVKIEKKGVYTLTGNLKGYVNVKSDENIKLILDNVNIENDNGPCILVESSKNIYIQLIGESTLKDSKEYTGYDSDVNGAIYSKDDLFITGDGILNLTANYEDGIVSKDDLTIISGTINIVSKDDAIRGKDSVTVKDGTININSDGDGIKTTNIDKGSIFIEDGEFNINSMLDAVQSESSITINDGTFNITTGGGSIVSSNNSGWGYWNSTSIESSKAIKAVTEISINGGLFNIDSSDDSIHSNGNINIKNGEFNLSSGDDGIHADETLIIDGGSIKIGKSYEGIEGNEITINGGDITIVSIDDGINVAGGNDNSSFGRPGQNNFGSSSSRLLTINGGNIYVNASGDGLDSNGSITMNAGTVIVDGPTDSGNGALDYDGTFTINGGILIAVGASGMVQNISNSSSQVGVLINFNGGQSANTPINISNLLTYVPSKQYSSIVISTPDLKSNETYTIYLGGTITGDNNNGLYLNGTYSDGTIYDTFTVSGIVNSVGSTMGMMGGMDRPNQMQGGRVPR